VTSNSPGADLVAITDADLVVAQPFHREVLAELPVDEVASSKLVFPVAIGVDLVDENGTVLAPVPGQIALAVALHIELAYAARAADGVLEHAREHGLLLPCDVLGHADVDRQKPSVAQPLGLQLQQRAGILQRGARGDAHRRGSKPVDEVVERWVLVGH
jgi:hypothetical protein